MILLMIMDAEELKDPQNFNKAMLLVSELRKNKINKMIPADKKRLSLAAGLLLRQGFCALKREYLYHEISYTELGKPFLPRGEYFCSLSHSGKFAICGISDQPIGCDIERKRSELPRYTKIFSGEEAATFSLLREADKIDFFFKLWTCKESITKWMGKGITFPFHTLSVMDGQNLKKMLLIEDKHIYTKSYSIEEYFVSVCSESQDFPEKIIQICLDQLLEH